MVDPSSRPASSEKPADPVPLGALPSAEETWVSIELLNRAQAGDAGALDQLLRRYEDRLRRVVRVRLDAKLRGLCESADVVQETLSAALTRIGDLQVSDRGAILRWLTRIAENEMTDLRRRALSAKRDRNREKALDTHFDLPARGDSPSEIAANRELQHRVDAAVASLPAEAREVILLRTYYGSSWEDVAAALGSPSAEAARKLHSRAMIKLARAIQQSA
ncbi:MAG: sigma-70 family RNA polymerase sigma factor [Planctomycetota bacterium]